MEVSHKTQAALQFLAPSAILYMLFGAYLLTGNWPTLAFMQEKSASLVFLGIAAMLTQDIVPKPIKEYLVFWRFKDRMPGHRAFDPDTLSNTRIDEQRIPNICDLSGASPHIQQREFYKLYKSVAGVRSVEHLSQRYIAWRDLSTLLVILALVGVPALYSFDSSHSLSAGFVLSSSAFLAYVLTAFAARNVADELVVQVLSLIGQGNGADG